MAERSAGSRAGSKAPTESESAKQEAGLEEYLPKLKEKRKSSKPAALQLDPSGDASALPSADPSPTSPVGRVVRKSATGQPPVAVVHRVSLREWQERKARPPSGGKEDVQLPSVPMVRRASMSSVMLADERSRRAPSMDRPMGTLEGTSVDVKPLGQQQVVKRTREATDWFRDARAINRSVRTVEDAESLLAQARVRRNSKKQAAAQEARKAQEDEWIDPEEAELAAEKAAKEKAEEEARKKKEQEAADRAAGKARVIDPAAMWGPKPVKKVEAAPPPEKIKTRRGRAGSITEGVKVGDGSFLRRMSTRRATIE